jgi:hypothetical protein
VARLAEVRVAPAEPLRNTTAELALELNVISAMFLTILDTRTNTDSRALRAHKLLWLILLTLLLSAETVLHPSEIGNLALEALIVGQFEKSIFLKRPIVGFLLEPGVFVQALKLASFY